MTQEHYEYRTSPFFLRNQFSGEGFLEIPTIPKPNVKREDLDDLLLIGFDKAKVDDLAHKNRFVHFFLYDYKFERVWNRPEHDLERLKNYTGVLSLISVCIWKWHLSCSYITPFAIGGVVHIGLQRLFL